MVLYCFRRVEFAMFLSYHEGSDFGVKGKVVRRSHGRFGKRNTHTFAPALLLRCSKAGLSSEPRKPPPDMTSLGVACARSPPFHHTYTKPNQRKLWMNSIPALRAENVARIIRIVFTSIAGSTSRRECTLQFVARKSTARCLLATIQ